jgi:hypothetical protein
MNIVQHRSSGMFRPLVARILGFTGRINGQIWDYAPLLQTAPAPPQLGRATRVPHLRVIEGSKIGVQPRKARVHLQDAHARFPDAYPGVSQSGGL